MQRQYKPVVLLDNDIVFTCGRSACKETRGQNMVWRLLGLVTGHASAKKQSNHFRNKKKNEQSINNIGFWYDACAMGWILKSNTLVLAQVVGRLTNETETRHVLCHVQRWERLSRFVVRYNHADRAKASTSICLHVKLQSFQIWKLQKGLWTCRQYIYVCVDVFKNRIIPKIFQGRFCIFTWWALSRVKKNLCLVKYSCNTPHLEEQVSWLCLSLYCVETAVSG